jgi:hypothetical protein
MLIEELRRHRAQPAEELPSQLSLLTAVSDVSAFMICGTLTPRIC